MVRFGEPPIQWLWCVFEPKNAECLLYWIYWTWLCIQYNDIIFLRSNLFQLFDLTWQTYLDVPWNRHTFLVKISSLRWMWVRQPTEKQKQKQKQSEFQPTLMAKITNCIIDSTPTFLHHTESHGLSKWIGNDWMMQLPIAWVPDIDRMCYRFMDQIPAGSSQLVFLPPLK